MIKATQIHYEHHHFKSLDSVRVPKTHLFSNAELEAFGLATEFTSIDTLHTPATPEKAVLLERILPPEHFGQSITEVASDLPLPEKSLCYFSINKDSRTLIWPLDSVIRETNLEDARRKMRMVPSFEHMLVNGFVSENGQREMTVTFSITPPIVRS
ncbi:hypothetical protein K7432_001966 [Basidiobolus ranarum]|uniref:Uncharacterized protein n=1 Tax=Basidiobolus ranarum TaxID=34480 RepID=A0ABR2X257_9FUNG